MSSQLNIFDDHAPITADVEPVETPTVAHQVDDDHASRNDCWVYIGRPVRVRMPVSLGTCEREAAELKRVIDRLYEETHDLNVFARWCDVIVATLDRFEPGAEERYLELVEPWSPAACRVAAEGFAILRRWFVEEGGFDDLLGRVYMEIRSDWGGKYMGQYFTPWPLVRLMADVNFDERLGGDRILHGPPVKILDPAVGSGAMLLAAQARVAEKFGRRYLKNLHCYGQDKDAVCAAMATIQIRMTNIPWMLNFLAATHSEMAMKAEAAGE